MGVSLVILTYKEEENLVTLLPAVIENLQKVTDDYELIIVDSPKSQDNTKAVCEKYGARYFIQEGPYYVSAYKTAIKNATKDIFFIMDADFSHPPEDIPRIYNAFVEGNCDMGIGSRYVEGGINDDEPKNIVYSKILNFAYRTLFGIGKVGDISGGFKIYRTYLLKNIDNFMAKYFEIQIEILVKIKLQKPDLKIVEVPIHFGERNKGESKRNYLTFLPQFGVLLIRLFFYKLFYRPKKEDKE